MIADIIYRGKVISEKFPKNDYQLSDLTDRMRSELPFNVRIDKLFGWDNVNNELRIDFFDDLVRLNLLAQRIEEMDEIEEAKMFALMTKYPEAEISELLDMTYGLESIAAYECCNDEELAECAFENDWISVLEDCTYEIRDYIDKSKVAEEIHEQREGYMYRGYYVEPDGYIRPDINIELPKQAEGFFCLQLAADCEGRIDRNRAEWLTLPCGKEEIREIEQQHSSSIDSMICLKAESSLPMISSRMIKQTDFSLLNELAEQLSELSRDDFIKLKAVMEMGEVSGIEWTMDVVRHLDEFDFDPNPMDESVYGKIFLYNTLPQGFNTEILTTADLSEFGMSILSAKGGTMTSYGAVTGQGYELYTSRFQEREQTASEGAEEETEMLFS